MPAKVKYENSGESVHIPLTTPQRRADFSEPLEPVVEPEATFVWKGEAGGGLMLDKVKNYEEFGLPLTDMKLHKKWRSNRARRIYFKEPTLDLCRMRNNNNQESSFEEELDFLLPGIKVGRGGRRRGAKINFDSQYLRLCNLLPLNQDPDQVNILCCSVVLYSCFDQLHHLT